MLYDLPVADMHSVPVIQNAALRKIFNMLRFSTERIAPKAFELHLIPFKSRVEIKIRLLAHKALFSGEPKYLKILPQPTRKSGLRS